MITEFTPISAIIGGLLIGTSSVLLMATLGRIAGISGILSGLLPPIKDKSNLGISAAFIVGLLIAIPIFQLFTGNTPIQSVSDNYLLLAAAGFIVGIGTVMGNGCTSGHGVCGISRLSLRSIIATGTFMIAAVITVYILRHGLGG